MRRLVVICAVAFCVTCQAAEVMLEAEVSRGLVQLIEKGQARAIAAGVYDNGEIQFSSFGRISRRDDSPPQANTVFEIGSITKVFTSLLTEVQAEAGRLSWDDTIADRLPDTEFASDVVGMITLRELASHASGLPRIPSNMDPPDPMNPYAGYGTPHLKSFLAGFQPETLEKEYAYSNLGAGLLGVLAADAAELNYADAMQRDVLRPLGLADSGLSIQSDQQARLAEGFSAGADMPNWDGFDALAGAGAMLSTFEDLMRFIEQNIAPNALDQALEAVRQSQAAGETGLGWHIRMLEDDGPPIYWHNGGTGGYASFLAIRPDNGTGAVILSTSTDYNAITELGFTQITGQSPDNNATTENINLDAYIGAYQIAEGFVLTITVDGGRLVGQATGQGAFPLTAAGENEFLFTQADIRITFELDETSRAEKLTLYQGGQVLPGPRVADDRGVSSYVEVTLPAEQLNVYVGDYQLTPAAVIKVLNRGSQLYAQLTGQAAFPIFAYEPDKFFYKVVDAQLQFERNNNNDVVAVILHQGGQQRAPRID